MHVKKDSERHFENRERVGTIQTQPSRSSQVTPFRIHHNTDVERSVARL